MSPCAVTALSAVWLGLPQYLTTSSRWRKVVRIPTTTFSACVLIAMRSRLPRTSGVDHLDQR
jgi:hypothetical protein